jgi:hypothetical protein
MRVVLEFILSYSRHIQWGERFSLHAKRTLWKKTHARYTLYERTLNER